MKQPIKNRKFFQTSFFYSNLSPFCQDIVGLYRIFYSGISNGLVFFQIYFPELELESFQLKKGCNINIETEIEGEIYSVMLVGL